MPPRATQVPDSRSLLEPPEPAAPPGEVVLLSPADALDVIRAVRDDVQTVMLDPWYNKGIGGLREDYIPWLGSVIEASFAIAQHIFVWGFPEIVGRVLDYLPEGTELASWLTWYYKNCPSVVRGWRSAQYACLHLARKGATLYPERFLNEAQLERMRQGKLRYLPGPPNVIEAPLNIGFVGRAEQTGHPAQKPLAVYEPLILMTTKPGDIVLDPMCGSGTTGAVCQKLQRRAILSDLSDEYTALVERRLSTQRRPGQLSPKYFFKNS